MASSVDLVIIGEDKIDEERTTEIRVETIGAGTNQIKERGIPKAVVGRVSTVAKRTGLTKVQLTGDSVGEQPAGIEDDIAISMVGRKSALTSDQVRLDP